MIANNDLSYWELQLKETANDIDSYIDDIKHKSRNEVSTNFLKCLRDFYDQVCCVLFLSRNSKITAQTEFDLIQDGHEFVSRNAKFNFLQGFYSKLRVSASHYRLPNDQAERVLLGYIQYLIQIKLLLKKELNLLILNNLDKYPLDLDSTFEDYYKLIIDGLKKFEYEKKEKRNFDSYYVQKKKMIYCHNVKFYEYTLTGVNDETCKFDRFTAFSMLDIFPNYAIRANLQKIKVFLFDKNINVTVITDYDVAIRPCEFDRLFDIVGIQHTQYRQDSSYRSLMRFIKEHKISLDKIACLPKRQFSIFKNEVFDSDRNVLARFFDASRDVLESQKYGNNTLRYLMYTVNNRILKGQIDRYNGKVLSDYVKVTSKDRYFENFPFVASLCNHNPSFDDLCCCFNVEEHGSELIRRFILNESKQNLSLYWKPGPECDFAKIKSDISDFNKLCDEKSTSKSFRLSSLGKNFFIEEFDESTYKIINFLKHLSKNINFPGYAEYAKARLLELASLIIDDKQKEEAVEQAFSKSSVFAVYGPAGTGKTTFAKYIVDIFGETTNVLCLANTNPALMNLKKRITNRNVSFDTVYKFLHSKKYIDQQFEIMIIDECSNISNKDMSAILDKMNSKLLLLIGDIYQIESVQFGNWFALLKEFIDKDCFVELKTEFRSRENQNLPILWKAVRDNEITIKEYIEKMRISYPLGPSIFERVYSDEIILCLNYDGLYGINNINKYLQANNPNPEINWRHYTFKVGDPVLFLENNRFGSVLYNNLKGHIESVIIAEDGSVNFKIIVEKVVNPITESVNGLKVLKNNKDGTTLISFTVYRSGQAEYEQDLRPNYQIPFQIAYAVSIHKSQGLEYDSVKIVISNEVEDLISHNIFYTAITRAKRDLRIYWTPETEEKVLSSLKKRTFSKDLPIFLSLHKDLK